MNEFSPPQSTLDCIVSSFQNFQLLDGRLQGEGTIKFKSDQEYVGAVENNVNHGFGTYKWSDGVTYKGDFVNGRITGNGRYTWPDGSWYAGEVLNGMKHGYGIYCDGIKFYMYIGQWKNDTKHGQGRLDCNAEGTWYYNGTWLDNSRDGNGVQHFDSGNAYNGEWKNGQPHGWGTMYWKKNLQLYEGMWQNGLRHGHGEQYWLTEPSPSVCLFQHHMYRGGWVDDKRDGYGIFIYSDGSKFEGYWCDNMKCGTGTFIYKNGARVTASYEEDLVMEIENSDQRHLTTPLCPVPDNTLLFCPDLFRCLPQFENYDYTEAEKQKLKNCILTKVSYLKSVYYKYSSLGRAENSISAGVMSGTQFIQFCRDLQLNNLGWSLGQIIEILRTGENRVGWPNKRLMPWKFTRKLLILSFHVFRNSGNEKLSLINCFKKLFFEHIKMLKGTFKGILFAKPVRTAYIIKYVDALCKIYERACASFCNGQPKRNITVRQFILFIKDIRLLGLSKITSKNLLRIMMQLIPSMKEGHICNFDLEICFLDFIDAIFACAETFYNDLTVEQTHELFGIVPTPNTSEPEFKMKTGKKKRSSDKKQIDIISPLGSITSRILSLQDAIPPQLLEIYSEDERLLYHAKDQHDFCFLPPQTPAELMERIRSLSCEANFEGNLLKYFSFEKIGDLTGDSSTDLWLLHVCHFLDHVFLPAANIWILIHKEVDEVRDIEAEIAAVESFSNIVLPHAQLSTVWFDES